jgi:hypothetical protein
MAPLDFLSAPLRSLLGVAERSPMGQAGEIEHEIQDAAEAIHRAADSMERHVEVVETLASSVPALTESVNALVKELNGLLAVLAPVADIEHPIAGAEREISRVGHLFGRRHRGSGESPAEPGPTGDAV